MPTKLNKKRIPKTDIGYNKPDVDSCGTYADIFSNDVSRWYLSIRKASNDRVNRIRNME